MTSRVLIAGAGDLGVRTGLLLQRAGNEVFALRRNTAGLPTELRGIAADLTRPETLTQLPDGLDGVVYCAAADASTDEAYQRAYVTGLGNVLQRLSAQPAARARVIFVSSTAVYAQTDGSWVTEASPTEPEHFSGVRTLQAEALLEQSGLTHCCVRAGGIYGPGRTRLLEQVRSGSATYDPQHPEYTNRIHVQDLAGAIVHLLTSQGATGVFNAVDHEPAPRREVLDWLAAQLGAPAPRPREGSGESLNSAEARPRRGRPSDKRVDGARLRATGYQFEYPTYREGYRALIQPLSPNGR